MKVAYSDIDVVACVEHLKELSKERDELRSKISVERACVRFHKKFNERVTKENEDLKEALSSLVKGSRGLASVLSDDFCEGHAANAFEEALLQGEDTLAKYEKSPSQTVTDTKQD